MGWYGGQDGARRLRLRDSLLDAYCRFRASLSSNVEMKDFTNNVVDNRDLSTIKMLLYDPTSQADLVAGINASAEDKDVAIAIGFSYSLQSLEDVSDTICQRLHGLFLFGTTRVNQAEVLSFIRRCPTLKSLTLAFVEDFDEKLLKTLFAESMLPKLEFLEVATADDDAIAAMHTSPNLQKIVFRFPDISISNAGFEQLVENGGGKNLVAISGGVLQKDLSKSLTKNFLKATLPKFIAGEASERGLEHISVGKKMPSPEERERLKYAQQDSLPFAVIPPERMNFQQLKDAFTNRGIYKLPHPASKASLRAALIEAGFTIEEETAIQNIKHAKHLSSTVLPSLKTAYWVLQARIEKVKNNSTDRLYPELSTNAMVSIMRKEYYGVPANSKRDDVAAALHKRKYQGGGIGDAHLTFLQQELARILQENLDTSEKIASLQADTNKYNQKKASKSTAGGTKRPLAYVN